MLNYNTNTKSSTRDFTKVASTTGNITGIYDMAGGAIEYVMGNYNDMIEYSDFTSMPDSKYYDKYTTTSALTACNGGVCYGHALSEVNGWYGDFAGFISADNPWLLRGGFYGNVLIAGVFASDIGHGASYDSIGFRAVFSPIGA